MSFPTLPLPPHYRAEQVVIGDRWLDYGGLEKAAIDWRNQHQLQAASKDRVRIGVLGIDNQDTFCHPQGELFVAGQSGTGAVDDSVRFVEWLYRHMGLITEISCTLDTHRSYAIFHPSFLVNDAGENPAPFTLVTNADVRNGVWRVSNQAASALSNPLMALQAHLQHYTAELEKAGRYALVVWPYHGMLGGRGHKLVTGLEEMSFFHSIARGAQPGFEVKGTNPLTENYSVLTPEVLTGPDGQPIAQRNAKFVEKLLRFDVLVIAGQAKSHCVAWTISDLLKDINAQDPTLARKVYLLEDCTSPVVVPGMDYTDDANKAFADFAAAGMHVVNTTMPIETWPGMPALG
jgi:nicotinamidase-related amidase